MIMITMVSIKKVKKNPLVGKGTWEGEIHHGGKFLWTTADKILMFAFYSVRIIFRNDKSLVKCDILLVKGARR